MGRPKKEKPNRQDGRYEIKCTIGKDINGQHIRKSFYSYISKEDAKKQADQYKIEMEVANRTGVGFIAKDISFSDWADKWLETYKKPDVSERSYTDTYRNIVDNHLKPYFKQTKLAEINPIDIKQFYGYKQNMSQSMLSKMRLCLNGIFSTAIDNNLMAKNPARGLAPVSQIAKNEKRVFTKEEIEKVINAAQFAMPEIVILLETGLRRGELLGLKWTDIDFINKTISVNRSMARKSGGGTEERPPKWNSYRINPLSEKSEKILKRIKRNGEFIFPKEDGSAQSPDEWSKKEQRFMNTLSANIPRLTPHELRHTYGTNLRRNGVDIYTIQKLMGHKDINITSQTYVKNEVETLRESLKKANI